MPVQLPPHVAARIKQKRGDRPVHLSFDPRRTALLVIDMQCYYLGRVTGLEAIVPRVRHLCDILRARGVAVVWLLNTLEREGEDLWPAYHEQFFDAESGGAHRKGLASGTPGHRLLPGLDPHADDTVLEKTRFSAFAPGSSTLEAALATANIENLLIAGTATNVCCESTARDAMMRGYRVAVVADAMAAVTRQDHLMGLSTLASCFADVVSAESVLGRLVSEPAPPLPSPC